MSANLEMLPLQPGDRAPNVVLDAITREGKIAIDDFRGQKPVLVGLYRGLHCPFCRRHIAALAQLTPALNEKGIESLTVTFPSSGVASVRRHWRFPVFVKVTVIGLSLFPSGRPLRSRLLPL